MLAVAVHSANVRDRDGAAQVVNKRTRRRFPFIEVIHADAGYQGPRVAAIAERSGNWRVEIVRRLATDKGFVVQPKRWIPDQVRDQAHAGLDQPQSTTGEGLRVPRAKVARLHPSRHDQDHATTFGQNINFPDGL